MGSCTGGGGFDPDDFEPEPLTDAPDIEPATDDDAELEHYIVATPRPPSAQSEADAELEHYVVHALVDLVTTSDNGGPPMPEITPEIRLKLDALKARLAGATDTESDMRVRIEAAKVAKREAEDRDARREAKADLADAREDRREARKERREIADVLRDAERDAGLRPGAIDDWIEARLASLLGSLGEVLREQVVTLEGRLVEALPGLVSDAAAKAVASVDFGAALPGKVGVVVEAVDDAVVATLSDLFSASQDDDGLTLDELLAIGQERLAEQGVSLSIGALAAQAQRLMKGG